MSLFKWFSKSKPTVQEAIDKCLAAGIKPIDINSAMMAIALDEIKKLKDSNAELLGALIDCRKALFQSCAIGELKVVDAAIAKARGEANG